MELGREFEKEHQVGNEVRERLVEKEGRLERVER